MNENDKTEILEPVETPAENITEPSKDGRRRPKWLPGQPVATSRYSCGRKPRHPLKKEAAGP